MDRFMDQSVNGIKVIQDDKSLIILSHLMFIEARLLKLICLLLSVGYRNKLSVSQSDLIRWLPL
jgi:hypothetical protein